MKKSILAPAIITCSLLLYPANANAAFWLDIIQAAAKGISFIVKDTPKGIPANKAQASPPTATTGNAAPAVEPTEQELVAAFDSLARHCKEFSRQGLPCGMHTAKSTISPGNALEIANTRADGELAKSVKQVVKSKTEDILKQAEDDEGNSSESTEYRRVLEIVTEQEISGAQTYITYSFMSKNDKGKSVYNVWVVRVLDVNIFDRALAESSQGKSIGQFVGEFVKSVASKVVSKAKKR